MDTININAKKREALGKATKKLKRDGFIPAVIYSADEPSENIQFNLNEFRRVYEKAGHSTLVDVSVDGNVSKVIIDEIQFNPRDRNITHAMLRKVNLKEEINAEIPVEIIGEAPAVKIEKGVVVTPVTEIEIKCLPMDLPQKIEVDITSLNAIGDSLTIADIKLPKGVELVHADDIEKILVTITAPQKEEEEVVAEVSPEDVELSVEKGKKEEGEAETTVEEKAS